MASRDLISNIAPAVSLTPRSATAAVNGTGVDLQGYDSAAVVIDTGTAAGTTPSFTIQIQESDDNSTYTAVAAGDLQNGGQLAAVTTATDDTLYVRGYVGNKRYVRVAVTAATGTSPTLLMAATVIRGHGSKPATLS